MTFQDLIMLAGQQGKMELFHAVCLYVSNKTGCDYQDHVTTADYEGIAHIILRGDNNA